MANFFAAESLFFRAGTLRVEVIELLEGKEGAGGVIGKPLEVQAASRVFKITVPQVGHFEVRAEPMGKLSKQAEALHPFLYREGNTTFLEEHRWGAETLASPRLPHGAPLVHFVIYTEQYVVDVLATGTPSVVEIPRNAA